ncbi:caspase family protein [Bradyrhizobium elkanii]|uniref:caspase family protein n=2 Tax=Bradyrhizobium elkanii TaxID=29448 RepID=UPI0027148CD8|nr:caspase family protein [Bradyrhizobium elkanii]WLB09516.1 caspase family protein [Bradyrhizobium elkanii]
MNADALIIGIDKYDRSDIPTLPGCVNDAVAAAKWLISIGVPSARIVVHVAPINGAQFPPDVVVQAADIDTILASFGKLAKAGQGDQLFIFMSGHGKSVPGAGPVFLCQNYLVNDITRANLKIDEYIEWFQSWKYKDQFLFYDACQDTTASIGQISSVQAQGPDAPPGSYKPAPGNALTACYACSAGERAWAGDGRGVLVRYSLEELDPTLWANLQADDPEQDAIQYDWTTGARTVDLGRLFTNIISVKISQAAASAQKFQTPFCKPHGRALIDGFSPIVELPPLPTAAVTVDVDPALAVGDVRSIRLQSQLIPRDCFMPTKGAPLRIPVTLQFPLQDLINAGCTVARESAWKAVNVPLQQRLGNPTADVIFQLRQPPPVAPKGTDGSDEINIVVGPGPGGGPMSAEIAKQLSPVGEIGGAKLPPNLTFRKDANGPSLTFNRIDDTSIRDAHEIAIDWLKILRRDSPGEGGRVIMSPFGQPKNAEPNVHFDFDKSSAALLGGFLKNDECVTLESFSDEMPSRKMSLQNLEDHPIELLAPGQYRITIDLPWGRWTRRLRVGVKADTVQLPQEIGLEPLRNRYRRDDVFGPELVRPDEPDHTDATVTPIAVRSKDQFELWVLPALATPVAVLETEGGIRAEPYSETSLREWDELLTVGRLNIADPAGLIKRLNGKIPDGTAEEFTLLAIAAAYAEYDRQNWSGLLAILDTIEESTLRFQDIGLLKLAAEIEQNRIVGNEREHAIYIGFGRLFEKPPVFRWGVALLTDLARQAGIERLPRWAVVIDPSSVITLIRWENLGLPTSWFAEPRNRRIRILGVHDERSTSPHYLEVGWLPNLDQRVEESEARRREVLDEIEANDAGDQTDALQKQKQMLEQLVEDEDAERVQTRDSDESTW